VGTADCALRIYKGSQAVSEVREADVVITLAPLGGSR
jgi:hypothetical protein